MITGYQFAEQARSSKYNGIPYSKLDCQAFVEEVAKDAGIRKPDGSIYNWKGSNSMWRNISGWKGTIQDCKDQFGCIPLGAWVFIRKTDGGEKDRGYNDNLGNFTHVGIYCKESDQPVRDSTRYTGRDGVGYRPLTSFTSITFFEIFASFCLIFKKKQLFSPLFTPCLQMRKKAVTEFWPRRFCATHTNLPHCVRAYIYKG